jgi:hypothetical protein
MRVEIFQEWGGGWTQKIQTITFVNADILELFLDYFKACTIQNKKVPVSLYNYFSCSMLHACSRVKINVNSGNIGAILREFYLGIGQIPDLTFPTDPNLPCNIALPADVKVETPKHIIDQLQRFGAVIQSAHNILIQKNVFLLTDLWVMVLSYLTSNDNIEMVTTPTESKLSFFASCNNKNKEKPESNSPQAGSSLDLGGG